MPGFVRAWPPRKSGFQGAIAPPIGVQVVHHPVRMRGACRCAALTTSFVSTLSTGAIAALAVAGTLIIDLQGGHLLGGTILDRFLAACPLPTTLEPAEAGEVLGAGQFGRPRGLQRAPGRGRQPGYGVRIRQGLSLLMDGTAQPYGSCRAGQRCLRCLRRRRVQAGCFWLSFPAAEASGALDAV